MKRKAEYKKVELNGEEVTVVKYEGDLNWIVED